MITKVSNLVTKRSLIILLNGLLILMLTPALVYAAVGVIDVTDGVWDSNWGASMGSGTNLNGFYQNVDASPGTSEYYFGVDTVSADFTSGIDLIEIRIDCDQSGDATGGNDLYIGLRLNEGIADNNVVADGTQTIRVFNSISYEVIGGNRVEMRVPVGAPHDLTDCLGDNNNFRLNSPQNSINQLFNNIGPTAIQLKNIGANSNGANTVKFLGLLAIGALITIPILIRWSKKRSM